MARLKKGGTKLTQQKKQYTEEPQRKSEKVGSNGETPSGVIK